MAVVNVINVYRSCKYCIIIITDNLPYKKRKQSTFKAPITYITKNIDSSYRDDASSSTEKHFLRILRSEVCKIRSSKR